MITSPERTETLKSIVGKFEAANPGTKVEIISLPWGEAFQKFATMVSAGELPDVMEMPDTWLSLYANNGLLESLEPYLAKWEHTGDLTDRALELGRDVKNTAYMLPYGFYLRAMFYNKKLFQEAGVAEPPKTMDEFVAAAEKVSEAARQVRLLPARRPGRPQRLGDVRRHAWPASNTFFNDDGTSTMNSEGWVKGLTWVVDLYKKGLAPKDSVNWGFNEIVAGFYTGTCAMLDQDPDALIAIAERMKPDDYGVTTMPKGPDGKTFPTIGYAGWSMMAASQNKDLVLEADRDARRPGRQRRVEQAHRRAARPQVGRERSLLRERAVQGLVRRAGDKNAVPTVMPTYLEEFAFFKDSPGHQDQPAGAARRHHARGDGQSVGRLPDQGAAEVPGQEVEGRP